MERVISPEERMRRAEEIYYRRQSQGVRVSTSSVNIGKANKISLGKKMVIQIIICSIIYLAFALIKDYNTIFSQNIINQTRDVLSYDVNFQNVYNQIVEYFNNNFNSIFKEKNKSNNDNVNNQNQENTSTNSDTNIENLDEKINEENVENSTVESQSESQENNSDEITNQQVEENNNQAGENQGSEDGASNEQSVITDGTIKAKLDAENENQMLADAEYIKQNCNIIKPIEGTITSGFGAREETEIISAFHQGVDIGAQTGTGINAAMEGDVIAASYAGDYGNHIKIQNGDILTVYAHCSKLDVQVGQHINQGQKIGEVGATGKVTGPHLHFEIRRDGRYVNPELILNF